jgi:hypothetical protein
MDPERSEKEIAQIRDAALRVAFTLPHKPHAKSSLKGKKTRDKQPAAKKSKKG